MATTLKHGSSSKGLSVSIKKPRVPKRATRNSAIPGELTPPYVVERHSHLYEGLVHLTALPDGASEFITCCKVRFAGAKRVDDTALTCLKCAICAGCPACVAGYIREETMRLGKWVTKDDRMLYPFEMDDTHLMNAIAKLERDKTHFKDSWKEWIGVLEAEARLRKLL